MAEAAFVAELCNLIFANLPDNLELYCEEQYSDFLHSEDRPSLLTEKARADLVVYERRKLLKGQFELHPRFIIEVKRATAPKAQIDGDLRRLIAVRTTFPQLKTYLIVVAEAQRPVRFVSPEGESITTRQSLTGTSGYFKVRRTFKAAHAYTRKERSQYACLVECFGDI